MKRAARHWGAAGGAAEVSNGIGDVPLPKGRPRHVLVNHVGEDSKPQHAQCHFMGAIEATRLVVRHV
jgi:hypothetical protein